ncbi:hypothetical protein D3877_12935 [Azospirillum cavernae]|uniref:Uncharacterized protein n=1 Tax=Azospirillum cavernae TaxID=2320860 RepID=A0A418VVD8_9PROT|nr:hypothetical protein [Azospirillum cavernae]RJF81122.1 hypothetical protein D3877_12935 [Azospirillum cavernae]
MMRFSFSHLLPGGRSRAQGSEAPPGNSDAPNEDAPADGESSKDKPEGDGEGDAPNEDGGDGDAAPEDDDPQDATARAFAKGWSAGRARCAAIFASPAAAGNIAAACELAFNTTLPVKQAVSVLAVTGKSGGGLRQAMASLSGPQIGSDGPGAGGDAPSGAKSNPLVAARAKATGHRPRPR